MTAVSGAALAVIGILSALIGIATWVKTKGKIGQAIIAALGGAFLSTLVISPGIITQQIPIIFKKLIDWIVGLF